MVFFATYFSILAILYNFFVR